MENPSFRCPIQNTGREGEGHALITSVGVCHYYFCCPSCSGVIHHFLQLEHANPTARISDVATRLLTIPRGSLLWGLPATLLFIGAAGAVPLRSPPRPNANAQFASRQGFGIASQILSVALSKWQGKMRFEKHFPLQATGS